MNSCYRCKKEKSELNPINEKLYCSKCSAIVKRQLRQSEGFNDIKCPKCNGVMTGGKASVHGTVWGILSFGLSPQHLWFEPADGSFIEKIEIESGCSTKAACCERCKIILISGDKRIF